MFNNVVLRQSSDTFEPAVKLKYADPNLSFNINLGNLPSKQFPATPFHNISRKRKAAKEEIDVERQVWAFFASTRWAPAEAGEQGVTWLELYIRYALDGGQTQTEWEKEQASGKDLSKREAVKRFVKIARRMLGTAAETHVKHLFRPSQEKARR